MQRYFSNKLENDKFILDNNDLYHIIKVMRMKDNDKIEVVYNNNVYQCCILNVNNDITIKVEKKLNVNTDLPVEIILAIPLLKEQKMDFIFQKATELGVNKFIPILTERSIIKLEQGKIDKKLERWTKICKEASEQSMRNYIPSITLPMKLEELNNINGLKIVCSTVEHKNSIKKLLYKNANCDKIIIVIGPEGGLSNKEEEILVKNGFNKTTLGPRIMRVETVPLFIMSIINYQFME